ncbi:hypothetical protein B0H12DRAFT_1246841 [Mycena haematopus]|nr:hypothetical protein B0H12DRAFT_1246841 [Mycena haematopus]
MAPPSSPTASVAQYNQMWKSVDKEFAAYWQHPLVADVLDKILHFKNTMAHWKDLKPHVADEVNRAYPVLRLLKRAFPEKRAEGVDTSLLDVWYGYTRLLCYLGTGPTKWMRVCIHDSYEPEIVPDDFEFPQVRPVVIKGDLSPLASKEIASMPKDRFPRPKATPPRATPDLVINAEASSESEPETEVAPTPVKRKRAVEDDSGRKALLAAAEIAGIDDEETSPRTETKKRRREVEVAPSGLEFSVVAVGSNPSLFPSMSSTSTAPQDAFCRSGPFDPKPSIRAPPPTPSSSRNKQPKSVKSPEGQTYDPDEDADADGDVVMEETPARNLRKSTRASGSGTNKRKTKRKQPTTVRDTDTTTIPDAIALLLSERQDNRKATEAVEFNVVPDGYRFVGTIRLPLSANPVYYNGMPATSTGKRFKAHESQIDEGKLVLEELSTITDQVHIGSLPQVACMSCIILGKKCTPVAFGSQCGNCYNSSTSYCSYNTDAKFVVDTVRRLGPWMGASPECEFISQTVTRT